jgi:hypothetical protein
MVLVDLHENKRREACTHVPTDVVVHEETRHRGEAIHSGSCRFVATFTWGGNVKSDNTCGREKSHEARKVCLPVFRQWNGGEKVLQCGSTAKAMDGVQDPEADGAF